MTNKTSAPAVQKVEPTTAADEAAKKRDEAAASVAEKAAAVQKKGPLSTAVNSINMTGDDGKPVEVTPGTVFEPAEVDMDFLRSHGAIRQPTEGEVALYEQAVRMKAAQEAANPADVTG